MSSEAPPPYREQGSPQVGSAQQQPPPDYFSTPQQQQQQQYYQQQHYQQQQPRAAPAVGQGYQGQQGGQNYWQQHGTPQQQHQQQQPAGYGNYGQQRTVPNYGSYQPVSAQATQNNTTVVVAQPQSAPQVTLMQRKPDTYLALSIFTLLCCCWLFGIIALLYALQVDAAYGKGDMAGAEAASRSARTWNIIGIVIGCISVAIGFIIVIISIAITAAGAASASANDYNN